VDLESVGEFGEVRLQRREVVVDALRRGARARL